MPFFNLNNDEEDIPKNLKISDEDSYLLLANNMIHRPNYPIQVPKYIELRKELSLNHLQEYKELDGIVKALVYGWADELEKSFDMLSSSFKRIDKKSIVYKGNNSIYGFVNLYMATLFLKMGNSIHKSEYYREALKTYRDEDDNNGLARCFELQANFYKNQKNYTGELEALTETLKYYRFDNNAEEVIKCQIKIAENYAHQLQQDQWERYRDIALDKINLAEASPSLKAFLYKSIGVGYVNFNMIEEACDTYRNAIINFKKDSYSKEYLETYRLLESCYLKNSMNSEAISCQKNIALIESEYSKKQFEDQLLKLEILHLIQVDNKVIDAKEEYETQILNLKNKLNITNEENERMIVLLSHDLREPVRGITSFVSLLDRSLQDKDTNDKEKEYLEYIKKNANVIAGHIEHLLKYIQLDNGNKEITDIDLNEIVRSVKEEIMLKRKDKNAVLSYTKLPTIKANRELVKSLFYNLIDNAVKFNENTPLVKIDCINKKNKFEISISDNGIGIADENKEKVFELFRKEHKNSPYDGWGVGLSISRKIINSLGGDIRIEDNVNGGTKVKFDVSPELIA
jgi:signal transduction histidine kinase